jgi:hypothetical protein
MKKAVCLAAVLAFVLVSCQSPTPIGPPPPPPPVAPPPPPPPPPVATSLTVSPKTITLNPGETQNFSATLNGAADVSWEISALSGSVVGSISRNTGPSVTYTAPETAPTIDERMLLIVRATGSLIDSAIITVPGTNPPPPPPDLQISEVGSTRFADNITWFEVYNPTSSAINLSNYKVRALGISSSGGGNVTPASTWTLPSMGVASKAYAVIGGKVSLDVFNTSKSVYIVNSPNIVPFWDTDGFVELTKAGATVDFVRFGASTDTPTTASAWSGANAPALPFSEPDLGKSIVRAITVDTPPTAGAPKVLATSTDTNSAADWSSRDFATPAGPNDVPAGAIDADNDGIPDSAEVSGETYNGLDLYAIGARAGKRDLFIEVDNMISSDPGLNPQRESLDKVVAAFAAHNIAIHFDAGNAFASGFNPALHNLGNNARTVPYASSISLSPSAGLASSLYALKAQNMDFARNLIFHYLILGSSQNANGASGSSGVAELNGNDFLTTFGGYGLNRNTTANTNGLINWQAVTIMHELGHNLNLHHGGDEDTNYKPNYFSIMNYEYQLNCLGSATGSSAGDRYYFAGFGQGLIGYSSKGITTYGTLFNGPGTANCSIDYSNGSSSDLDENHLNENTGLGRGSSVIDWNINNTTETNAIFDINFDSISQTVNLSVFHDFDDWTNLSLPFARTFYGFNNGIGAKSVRKPLVVVLNDAQTIIQEETPNPEFFRILRESLAQR